MIFYPQLRKFIWLGFDISQDQKKCKPTVRFELTILCLEGKYDKPFRHAGAVLLNVVMDIQMNVVMDIEMNICYRGIFRNIKRDRVIK